jgi:DNA-binding NtrC family response regulator
MPLTGHRILLVEDEVIIAFDIENIVRAANGKVAAHATSLAKALKLADTANLTLAILDFRLGREDSLPVAKKLYAARVPFIFYTGNAPAVSGIWPLVPIVPKPAPPNGLIGALVSLTTQAPGYVAA